MKRRTDRCSTCSCFYNPESTDVDTFGLCDFYDDSEQVQWNTACYYGSNSGELLPDVLVGPAENAVKKSKKYVVNEQLTSFEKNIKTKISKSVLDWR